jgi:hypothetical protein
MDSRNRNSELPWAWGAQVFNAMHTSYIFPSLKDERTRTILDSLSPDSRRDLVKVFCGVTFEEDEYRPAEKTPTADEAIEALLNTRPRARALILDALQPEIASDERLSQLDRISDEFQAAFIKADEYYADFSGIAQLWPAEAHALSRLHGTPIINLQDLENTQTYPVMRPDYDHEYRVKFDKDVVEIDLRSAKSLSGVRLPRALQRINCSSISKKELIALRRQNKGISFTHPSIS